MAFNATFNNMSVI